MKKSDSRRVSEMMQKLWPEEEITFEENETVFVWVDDSGEPRGFVSFSLRPWVEGGENRPCPHVEGWFVEPELRKKGVGRALIRAVEGWCREKGYLELTSDVEIENIDSLKAHKALGFYPTSIIQYFRKKL